MGLHPDLEQRHSSTEIPDLDPLRRTLDANQDWYQDIVEHSQDLLCIHNLEGRLLSVNPAPARALGYSVDELLRTSMRELVVPEFRLQFDAYLAEVGRTGQSHGLINLITRAGERRVWRYYSTLRTEGVAHPIVRGIAHDITEQFRAEKSMREISEKLLSEVRKSEVTIRELQLFRTLLDNSNDAIEVLDPKTCRFLDVNAKACEDLGYSREELLSMKASDINTQMTEAAIETQREKLETNGSLVWESIHRRKDGITFPVEVSMKLVRLDRDYAIAVCRDLTERRMAESRLKATEERNQLVHERAPVGICWVESKTGRLLRVNPKYCEIVGRTEKDLLNRDFQSLTHPDDLPRNLEKLRQLRDGEIRSYEIEKKYFRPDGSVRWVHVEAAATCPEGQLPVWHMAIVQDVTERKRAKERLREFERVVENLEEMVVVVDRSYRYTLANKAFLRYWNLGEEQVVGHSVAEVIQQELFESVAQSKLDECFRGNVVKFEATIRYPTLGSRDISLSYSPVEGASGVERVACVMRDVTEQKKAELALRESEGRERSRAKELETVLEAVPVAVCIAHDRDCQRITGNWAAYEQLGLPQGSNISHSVVPDERPAFRLLENGVEVPPEMLPIQQSAATGKPVNRRELTLQFQDGSKKETIVKVVPLLNEEGQPRGAVAASVDVTELRMAGEALRQSEERFRVALKHSPITVFNLDLDLRYTWMYSSWPAEASESYLGKTPHAFFGREEGERVMENRRAVLKTGQGLRQLNEVHIKGNKRYLDTTIEPVFDLAGAVVGLTGASMDVTELREATDALREAQGKLTEEKLYLEHEIDTELGFGEIIGRSAALKEVMASVAKVATSDATVLLLGETGTGKELLARAIHRNSKRKDKGFIKLNCAAIPSGLLESELFGHEKGAFTGAIAKKLGRIELADQGTLFLDEIGEIPLELQPKLLRVLQDQEFERLGGNQTLKVNFRLVTATNRELRRSVEQREFRSDLYYRLNVFPIRMPPLRERREDIPLLIEHFLRKYAARMGKSITSIPAKTMEALVQWAWPGNIRELENFVERSVILTPGTVLQVPLSELLTPAAKGSGKTLRERERERILQALRECNGKMGGPEGAAARLGLKRTTLQSRLGPLGIDPSNFRD